jgi:hypothetical protein
MGTNYYRIPTEQEMEERKSKLLKDIDELDMSPSNIESNFRQYKGEDSWDTESAWDRFINETSIHLGKRSGGWKFCWNFHNNKYYSNKEELIQFVLNGRVVDEYGDEINSQEFLDMAFEWNQPDGLIADEKYMREKHTWMSNPQDYADKIIDGLRVSTSTEFS